MTDKQIIQDYLSTLTEHPHNTKRLFAIGFIGLPGTGKSTVATLLAETLGLPISRNDQIRRYLNSIGFEGPSPRQDLIRVLAEARTEWFYTHNTSVIVDADFSEQRVKSELLAQSNNAVLLLVKTECPPEIAIARIKKRIDQGDATGFSMGDEQSYQQSVLKHEAHPTSTIFFTVHTDAPLQSQVDALILELKAQNIL